MRLAINDTQNKNTLPLCCVCVLLFIYCCAECRYAGGCYAECHYAEFHYTECRYAECREAIKYLLVSPSLYIHICLMNLQN